MYINQTGHITMINTLATNTNTYITCNKTDEHYSKTSVWTRLDRWATWEKRIYLL